MSALIDDFKNFFDSNHQFQKQMIDELKRIQPEHITALENMLKSAIDQGRSFDEELVKECLHMIYDKADHANDAEEQTHQQAISIFKPKTNCDKITWISKTAIDVSFGVLIGGSFFVFFSQNGYTGLKIIVNKINDHVTLEDISYSAKMAIAALTGASSGVLGFLCGTSFTSVVNLANDYAQNNLMNKIKVVLAGGGCAFSSASLAGAVKAMTDHPNLYNISTFTFPGMTLIAGNWMLGTLFDIKPILNLLSKNNPSHYNMINWLENNKLSDASLAALRNHGYFKQAAETADEQNDNEIRMQLFDHTKPKYGLS
jgi:hypothetical protein